MKEVGDLVMMKRPTRTMKSISNHIERFTKKYPQAKNAIHALRNLQARTMKGTVTV